MLTDIQIAQNAKMEKIVDIAKKLHISEDGLELYGDYKAKVKPAVYDALQDGPDGKLVLVTAISPTPAGEGKTTTTVGLGDAMTRIGKKTVIALREPSLGPVFGVKGGAAGGGYAQVLPMEDINLHFTGDIHAMTAANNLLCAVIDNSIYQGNPLNIDPEKVIFKRALDMNDRALRHIRIGLGSRFDGVPRDDGFMITVASEVMAILCLASGIEDLKQRLGSILIGYAYDDKPVFCRDLGVQGALAALLKDAIKPNLVQTIEGTPCFMHGGPFANIAHGCNSIMATKLALKLGDYCITEAGFGSDLGGEKFLDIKCRMTPAAIVLVATIRALKYHGGVEKADLGKENTQAVADGLDNLAAHIDSLKNFGRPIVVAINQFPSDTEAEIAVLDAYLKDIGIPYALSQVHARGGEGGIALAKLVAEACDRAEEKTFQFTYPLELPIKDKILAVVQKVYGGKDVQYSEQAEASIRRIEQMGFGNVPVCMAKTQYSLTDDAKKLGRPTGFTMQVRDVTLSAGAGFAVVLTGNIMTMPGLPKEPAALQIDVDSAGKISGLF